MPEFFADAAIYYAARDGRDLAARLAALRDMPESEKAALRARAVARADRFAWESTASQTVDQLALALQ